MEFFFGSKNEGSYNSTKNILIQRLENKKTCVLIIKVGIFLEILYLGFLVCLRIGFLAGLRKFRSK